MFSSAKGKLEIAVWRKSDGNWYISPQNLPYEDQGDTRRVATLGGPNDTPVPADYDGDGKAYRRLETGHRGMVHPELYRPKG